METPAPPIRKANPEPTPSSRLVFAAAAVIVVLTGLAHGQTLKIATLAPDGSGWINTLRDIDSEVRERTRDKVRLKIYPGGVQGNEDVMIRKIRVGQLHGGGFGGTGTSKIFPDVLALEMPFLFEDYDEMEHVLAETQEYYRRGYSDNGYILLGWFDVGFVYLFSQKPIAGVDDIRGLKVWRLQGEPVSEVLFDKIGVTSVPLSIPDVLLGLQTDLVEVVYTSPAAAIVLQWFTRVGYYSTLPINHVLGAFLVDRRAFAKLPEEHQQILREVSERHIQAQRILNRADNREALRVITDHGVVAVDLPAPEIELFERIVAESVPELKGRAFSDESYEMVSRSLGEYRQRGAEGIPEE